MKALIVLSLVTISLVACHNDNDTAAVENILNTLSSKATDSEPNAIGNAASLQNDINALFKGVDPVEVEPGDTIQDVITRAGGS